MKYTFPAFITKEDNACLVTFPDLEDTFTDGCTMDEALQYAEDALNLMLWTKEEDNIDIPHPTAIENLQIPPNAVLVLVKADTLAYKRMHDTKVIRKNVSIPHWLDQLARNKNINFSNLLQKALIQELGIK